MAAASSKTCRGRAHRRGMLRAMRWAAQGGPEIDEDDIHRGYARGAIHGISTAVFSWAHVQVTDRSANVFQSMAEGACSLAHDLDALATLD